MLISLPGARLGLSLGLRPWRLRPLSCRGLGLRLRLPGANSKDTARRGDSGIAETRRETEPGLGFGGRTRCSLLDDGQSATYALGKAAKDSQKNSGRLWRKVSNHSLDQAKMPSSTETCISRDVGRCLATPGCTQ